MHKVIVITGSASGLGKILVEELAKHSHAVYSGIRKQEDIKQLKLIWAAEYPNIFPIKIDVTNDQDCQKAIKHVIDKEGKIDVLINNAGYTLIGPTEKFTSEDYSDLLNTNVIGAFRLIREVIPFMKQKKSGHIINITSLNGVVALPNFSLYCSSKFALEGLGRSLGHELSTYNISITNVEPGAIKKTGGSRKVKKMPHTPFREKYWLIKLLLPMVEDEVVAQEVARLVEKPSPPTSMLIGMDAIMTTFLQRFLPQRFWNKIIKTIWNR